MKQEILDSFRLYLKKEGFNRIIDFEDQPNQQFEIHQSRPDISAESKNMHYWFRFEDGTSSENELVRVCRNLIRQCGESGPQLRLLVPVDSYDSVLQTLNKYQMEDVGVIRINI